MKTHAVGVDLGGTSIKLGLFTCGGALVKKWEIPTNRADQGSRILPEIADSISGVLAEENIPHEQIQGIGIGVPGPVDGNGTVNKCVNLGWGVFNLRERMNELLPDIPNVAAGNDANVAALGELWQGGGMGRRSAVLFTLGTGVGGGVVLDGKIVAGANGGAGEVGHITVEPRETVPCGCGKRGCLEQYASASGIVRLAKRMLAECGDPSGLRALPDFTAKDICDLAREGDPMAVRIVDRCGEYLGRAMSYVACAIDPDVFVVGGGMSRAGSVLTDAIRTYYRKYAFHTSTETDIGIARLGNDAGIYGGAKMILDT
nr:ROK family glucokinase [uncultured Oscillibacter sp.]